MEREMEREGEREVALFLFLFLFLKGLMGALATFSYLVKNNGLLYSAK